MGCSTESTGDDEWQGRKEGMERRGVEWERKSRRMLIKKKRKLKEEGYKRRGGEWINETGEKVGAEGESRIEERRGR